MSPGPAERADHAAARRRRVGRAVAALAAIGATLLPELPALGAPPAVALPLSVTIDEQRFGVAAGDPMTFEITVSDDGEPSDRLADGATVTVALHEPVDDAAQLAAIDDQAAGAAVDSVAFDLAAVLADEAAGDATTGRHATVTVPTALGAATEGDDAISAPGPGVYPVTIAVVDDGVTVGSTTTIVELYDPSVDPDTGTIRLALLAGVDDPGPWPTAGALTAARAGIDGAGALSAAVAGPLSVRLPPAQLTPAAESIAGDAAAAFDGDELLAQPAIPLDPSSIAALGRAGLFTDQLVAGENAAAAAAPLAARTRTVWLVDGPLSTGGAALLRDLGVQLVIVPADVAAELGVAAGADVFEITLDSADSMSGLVISPLGAGLAAPEPGTSAAVAAARVMAAIELNRSGDRAPAAVALAKPDLGLPDPSVTAAFARYAGELPGVSIVPVSDLAGPVGRALSSSPPQPPVGLPAEAGADLSVRADAIDAERDDADQARSMLVDTADADAWDAGFDDLLARTIDDSEAAVHLAGIAAQIDGILGAIIAPEPFAFTLTGTESDLRLTITNTASQPLRAVVRVRSAKLAADPQEPVVVPAQQELVVPVPVTARSNGTFTVEVDVLTPAGQRIAGPVALRGSVRRVTGLSQLVTGGAVLALASWWYSHFRRNRRARLAGNGGGPRRDVDGADESLSPDAAEARSAPGDQRSR